MAAGRPSGANEHLSDDPYKALALAIVERAIEDYFWALRSNNQMRIKKIEEFFYGEWFATLTTLDPDALIEKSKKEYESWISARTKKKKGKDNNADIQQRST